MSFENHLFISYAHVDNMRRGDHPGWITRFQEHLEAYLSTNLGQKARVWRDDELRSSEIFANKIVKRLPKTALLLSVFSPRYLESDWCAREVSEFCEIAKETGGLAVDDTLRVFRVMLKPLSVDECPQLPAVIKHALGYEFYEVVEGKRTIPLDPDFGNKEAYNRNIYFLAEDAANLINKLDKATTGEVFPEDGQAISKPSVYLAECSYDHLEERDKVRGELQAHGYTILPDQRLPGLEMDYVAEVDRLLDQCTLSIHLIGAAYGNVPDGTKKSNEMLQNECAVEKSITSGLQRVIWLPEDTSSEQVQQQSFIEALHKDAEMQTGADLITGDLETLKCAIHATLKKIGEATQQTALEPQKTTETGRPLVYVICDKMDRKATIPLVKYLRGRGFEVKLPTFTGDATAVREANESLMKTCDAVLLFWGAGDEAWNSHQENDLRKSKGLREKPFRATYTYLAEPKTDDKDFMVEVEERNIIDGQTGFGAEAMEAFTQAANA